MSHASTAAELGSGSSLVKSARATTEGQIAALFPLRLSPLEQFFVLDEQPDCPLTSWIELHFGSPLNVNQLADALHKTVHRHPLLASRLVQQNDRWFWTYDPDFIPLLRDPADDPMLIAIPGALSLSPRPIDLTTEPGCRYWYDESPDGGHSRLTIQLHHACCDGVGLRQVLIDALSAYADGTIPKGAEFASTSSRPGRSRRRGSEPDWQQLLDRADFSELESRPAKVKIAWWQNLRNAYYFYCQPPTPIQRRTESAASSVAPDGSNQQPLRHHIFDEVLSTEILELCRVHEIAINDLSLALLFRVCRHWNRLRGVDSARTRIRLLMPVDLRSRRDLTLPATNRLSFSFLGRTHAQVESWPDLLRSVQEETNYIKDSRIHLGFLHGLRRMLDHPQRLRKMIQRNPNMSTSVLTYTGDIARGMKSFFPEENGRRRIGDSFLENILIAPPARRNTNLTLGLCINWGQICLSANWNRQVLSEADTVEFLRMFASAWREWVSTMKAETVPPASD